MGLHRARDPTARLVGIGAARRTDPALPGYAVALARKTIHIR